MSMQMVTFDDENMQSGKFYEVLVNKDNANAVILAPPFDVMFEDSNYIAIPLETRHSVEIWKVERFNEHEKHTNITNSVDWYILKPQNLLIINSSKPITGYVKFI